MISFLWPSQNHYLKNYSIANVAIIFLKNHNRQ